MGRGSPYRAGSSGGVGSDAARGAPVDDSVAPRTPGRWGHGQAGSVTAEFAVALPVVILVLAGCLGAVQVASQQVRLSDAAADAARTLARGDPVAVATQRVKRMVPTAEIATSRSGEFVCAELSAPAGGGPLALTGLTIRASSCALAGGL